MKRADASATASFWLRPVAGRTGKFGFAPKAFAISSIQSRAILLEATASAPPPIASRQRMMLWSLSYATSYPRSRALVSFTSALSRPHGYANFSSNVSDFWSCPGFVDTP